MRAVRRRELKRLEDNGVPWDSNSHDILKREGLVRVNQLVPMDKLLLVHCAVRASGVDPDISTTTGKVEMDQYNNPKAPAGQTADFTNADPLTFNRHARSRNLSKFALVSFANTIH